MPNVISAVVVSHRTEGGSNHLIHVKRHLEDKPAELILLVGAFDLGKYSLDRIEPGTVCGVENRLDVKPCVLFSDNNHAMGTEVVKENRYRSIAVLIAQLSQKLYEV